MKQDKNINRVDKGWHAMNDLLDQKMPQKKKRNRFLFFWLFLFAGAVGSKFAYDSYITNDNTQLQKETILSQYNKNKSITTISDTKSVLQIDDNKNSSNPTFESKNSIIGNQEINLESQAKNKNLTADKNKQTESINFNKTNQSNTPATKSIIQNKEILNSIKSTNSFVNENLTIPIESNKKSNNSNQDLPGYTNNTEFKISSNSIKSIEELKSIAFLNKPNKLINTRTPIDLDIPKFLITEPKNHSLVNQFSLNYGLKLSGLYFTNIKNIGVSPSAFIELEKNTKWGIGIEILSSLANRNNSLDEFNIESLANINGDSPELEVDKPEGLGLGSNTSFEQVLNESQRGNVLNQYITNLNSFGINVYTFFKLNKKFKISLGFGIDQYIGSKSLNNVFALDLNNQLTDPTLSTFIFPQNKIIANLNLGINYKIVKKLDLTVRYDYALENLVEESGFVLNTNRIKAGLSYNF